jgi:hypothetical protein
MSEIPAVVWTGVILAVVHMALCHVLLARVKKENPQAYEKSGAFHLFLNNTPHSTLLFWKWLCTSVPNSLSTGTRTLVWVIRAFTLVFLCWFATQVGGMFWR